jgi:hypothetical protein
VNEAGQRRGHRKEDPRTSYGRSGGELLDGLEATADNPDGIPGRES